MTNIHVFTSCALNYIPKARALFNSLRQHHPEFTLHLALVDAVPDLKLLENEPFDELHSIDSLGIPSYEGWAFCHEIVELCTAVKPFVLQRLLAKEDCDAVIYFDPDMVLFSRVDDIVEALQSSNIVLTPHQTEPETTVEAIIDNEICSLKHGIYNLGFFAVRSNTEGKRFADWWAERLYHFCRADIANGLFTDQRWIDLVPVFFDGVGILRSPRHNVATWNLTTRNITGSLTSGFLVNNQPLGFYHFTGFDSGNHFIMANKNASKNNSVQELIHWYQKEIKKAAEDPLSKVTWKFGCYTDGKKISSQEKLVYRERADLQYAFPNPFENSGKSYQNWFETQAIKEYPKLFNPQTQEAEIARIASILTPGYRGGNEGKINWQVIFSTLKTGLTAPKEGARFLKKVFDVISHDGLGGLLRRIRVY